MASVEHEEYRFNTVYWIFVLAIALVWTISWVNLGPSNRLLKAGWDQPLRRACASRVDICRSIEITEIKGWFGVQHRVLVQCRAGQGDAVLGLLNDQLRANERPLVLISLNQFSPSPGSTNSKSGTSKGTL